MMKYANTGQFYKFMRNYHEFKVGDLVVTDYHEHRSSREVWKIEGITMWISQTNVKITARSTERGDVLSVDAGWFRPFKQEVKKTATLDDFF